MRKIQVIVLISVLAGWLSAFECGGAITQIGAFSRVVSAEVRGYVFYADGETPASGVPVRIWDALMRQFIFETETDENGYFDFPKLEAGKYYVTFDWVKLELEVMDNRMPYVQQPHDIIVVIPRGTGFMPLVHLQSLLVASTISEIAVLYREKPKRPPVVSP